jgi:hypothetical protein
VKHVVICGQAPLSFVHPSEAEVWVINGPKLPPRWDVLFQLHGLHHIEQKHGTDYLEWLKTVDPDRRLIMPVQHCMRGAVAYPLRQIRERFRAYLNNSVPLAIAYALYVGPPSKLWLDGMFYLDGGKGEPDGSVRCIEYWLGVAEGMGVEVLVPPGCGLLEPQPHVYGFEGPGSV